MLLLRQFAIAVSVFKNDMELERDSLLHYLLRGGYRHCEGGGLEIIIVRQVRENF